MVHNLDGTLCLDAAYILTIITLCCFIAASSDMFPDRQAFLVFMALSLVLLTYGRPLRTALADIHWIFPNRCVELDAGTKVSVSW